MYNHHKKTIPNVTAMCLASFLIIRIKVNLKR